MYNRIVLVGNITRDIELRYSQGGMGIAKTAIATSRKFTVNGEKKEEICFVDITFFGRSAEVANQYLRKGSKILVEGRLSFEQWVDQNGQKRSKHSVIVESMQMLDNKSDNQGGGQHAQQQDGHYSNDGYNEEHSNAPQESNYANEGNRQPQSYRKPQQQPATQNHTDYRNPPVQTPSTPRSLMDPSQGNAPRQAREMPSSNSVPVIDIDEDEIPF